MNFVGKVVVITGGTAGIGRATAIEFAHVQAHVHVCGRNIERNEIFSDWCREQDLDITCWRLDVTDRYAMQEMVDKIVAIHGRLDVWINNAGVAINRKVLEFDDGDWDTTVNTNLRAVYEGSRIAARHMINLKNGGVIINASSYAALIPHSQGVLYAMTKAGVSNLTKSLAANFAPYGIRVFGYIPGMIQTEMSKDSIKENGGKYIENVALQRLGKPEDLSKLIVYLSSEAAGYFTGTDIEITGGKYCVQNASAPWDW